MRLKAAGTARHRPRTHEPVGQQSQPADNQPVNLAIKTRQTIIGLFAHHRCVDSNALGLHHRWGTRVDRYSLFQILLSRPVEPQLPATGLI